MQLLQALVFGGMKTEYGQNFKKLFMEKIKLDDNQYNILINAQLEANQLQEKFEMAQKRVNDILSLIVGNQEQKRSFEVNFETKELIIK